MRAYAPASVTGLFAPAGEGEASYGASFAIEDGVVVAVEPAERTAVTVDGDPASFEPVEDVLSRLGVSARVDVRPEIPLGNGFGASGAATLATALAANAAFDLGRPREELLEAAHRAELAAGTGQGDVFIQDRGGLLWSVGGDPNRIEPRVSIEYATAGGIDTSELLADEAFLADARRCGRRQLERLAEPPDLRELAARSRSFVEDLDVTTPYVRTQLDRIEDAGGTGSMALFGETVFAVDVSGVLPHRTRISNEGARLLDEER